MAPKSDRADHGSVCFYGDADASFQRHLCYDYVINPAEALPREQFEALSHSVRDFLSERWLATAKRYEESNPKYIYYLSMEFLIGRSLVNNVINLMADSLVRETMRREGLNWRDLAELELDAGLGNGGLGRLAACFIDSMATMGLPAIGYGLRYEYGMFKQSIQRGYQVEQPDRWLRRLDPWEVVRPSHVVESGIDCTIGMSGGRMQIIPNAPSRLLGVPYDRPVVGYGGDTINTLRLWGVTAREEFDYKLFNSGDIVGSIHSRLISEIVTRVLYPDDSSAYGKGLRFLQEYFLVTCSLTDIIARFRAHNSDWGLLPDKVAIQLNDTHPALAVAELMRILLDRAGLDWDVAWDITQRTLAYTNHTLLPEALEKWPVELFDRIASRHLQIIFEINKRFLDRVQVQYPGDTEKQRRMSLIEEGPVKQVRMAHLAIVGSHSVNGVAKIHSDLVKSSLVPDFYQMFPERFNNKTNGVSPRRWLLQANPPLAKLITESIGDGWVVDLSKLRGLLPLAQQSSFREAFMESKREAKMAFASWLKITCGEIVDPDSIFDCQIKRIHEYKRQLLNILHVVVLYDRIKNDSSYNSPPRTFFFAGKAAPAYAFAKVVIKLINSVAQVVNRDPSVKGRLKVLFLPDYNVSLAERIIPAADVSEQISTAGYEASGTGNMKFMMNGALTVGTRDGATIEMAEECGEDNIFLFGLTAEQVSKSRSWYSPWWHYNNEPEARRALDMISSDLFCQGEPGLFGIVRRQLLDMGDPYMHLADLRSYCEAHTRVAALYSHGDEWAKKAILNVACSGKFSSDRTIEEYAREIWSAKPLTA